MAKTGDISEELNTLQKLLRAYANFIPDEDLFVFYAGDKPEVLTCEQVWTLSGKMAAILKGQGFKRNDVIANTLPNSPERIITDLGILCAGCIPQNGQILMSDGEDFFQSARLSKCRGVVVCPEDWLSGWTLLGPCVQGSPSGQFASMSCGERAPDLKTAVLVHRKSPERSSLKEMLQESTEKPFYELGVPEDTVYVFTTSGSSGYSKLVPRDHGTMMLAFGDSNTHALVKGAGKIEPKKGKIPTKFNDRPLGWLSGCHLITFFQRERRIVMDALSTKGDPSIYDVWNALSKERCTSATLMSSLLNDIAVYLTSKGVTLTDEEKLDTIIISGQPIKQSQVSDIFKLSKSAMVYYAGTELNAISVGKVTDASQYSNFYSGRTIPGVQLRILDSNGDDCPPGQTGVMLVKGPFIFRGYFNKLHHPDPETVKAFTDDGWFKTGDKGYLDEDGNLYVVGRDAEVIHHGPTNLYPAWLEAKITSHPEVLQAAVVPVSDPKLFHAICACVKVSETSKLTVAELREYVGSLFAAKIDDEFTPMPEYFKIFKGSEFPLTGTGKTYVVKIRKMMEEEFGIVQS